MKHTKAPWAWQKFGDAHYLTAQHGLREIIIGGIDLNSDHQCCDNMVPARAVAAMNNDGIVYPVNPEHSNAKLIASAPDLLEALDCMLYALEVKSSNKQFAINAAIKAIKKATE